MPLVPFSDLPPSARVWVFAADRPVTGTAAERLLGEVDAFLARWMAHGAPLSSAREWRDDRFLVIGVDPRTANASGCSIDGLFRTLRALEPAIGASLVGGGRVYFRGADGAVRAASRDEFSGLAASGAVTSSTRVFDPTVTTLGDWRDRFEIEAARSWHAALLA
jgi:hypothetical protein